ncbi:hypothetical protein BH23BAC1_BH23BAC1_37480 [soil metagenome]
MEVLQILLFSKNYFSLNNSGTEKGLIFPLKN